MTQQPTNKPGQPPQTSKPTSPQDDKSATGTGKGEHDPKRSDPTKDKPAQK